MNKLSKEKRDRLILVGLGTAGILAALYFLVVSSQDSSLREYTEKIGTTKEKLTKAERWLRMAPGIQAKLDSGRKELEAKQEGMAPTDKFKWFYDTLDRFVAQRPVKLIDITREPEISDVGILPKFPYQAATFGVKLSARFNDLGIFLADFENEFPYMRVKNLVIEPEGALTLGSNSSAAANNRPRPPQTLSISLRVVTLVKPNALL